MISVYFRRVSLALAGGLAFLLSGLAATDAAGDSGTASAATSAEAWYTTTGECEAPAECSPPSTPVPAPAPSPVPAPAPSSPYPEDTLHTAISAGRPSAATYVALDTSAIPPGSVLTGGTMTLPLDSKPGDGSISPDKAKLQVCVVTDVIEDGTEGSASGAPKTDCKRASTAAQFKAGKQPVFTIDLTAFAATWSDGVAPAVAIVPSPDSAAERQTWHVTFWGKDSKDKDAKPITAQLSYRAGDELTDDFPLADDGGLGDFGGPVGPGVAGPPFEADAPGIAAAPPPEAPAPEGAPGPEEAAGVGPELAPQTAPAMRQVGYAQRVAWLFPLLLILGFAVTGLSLTKTLDVRQRP